MTDFQASAASGSFPSRSSATASAGVCCAQAKLAANSRTKIITGMVLFFIRTAPSTNNNDILIYFRNSDCESRRAGTSQQVKNAPSAVVAFADGDVEAQ